MTERKTIKDIKVFKFEEDVKTPTRSHEWDAGLDFYAYLPDEESIELAPVSSSGMHHYKFNLQLTVEVPKGYALIFKDRSGLSNKQNVFVCGGVIDHGYTGAIEIGLINNGLDFVEIEHNQKISQAVLVPVEVPEVTVVSKLEDLYGKETDRGDKGFGSTG